VQGDLWALDDAREHPRRALTIFERSLGQEHPHTATARKLVDSPGAGGLSNS
jgi:hypothetical protein